MEVTLINCYTYKSLSASICHYLVRLNSTRVKMHHCWYPEKALKHSHCFADALRISAFSWCDVCSCFLLTLGVSRKTGTGTKKTPAKATKRQKKAEGDWY